MGIDHELLCEIDTTSTLSNFALAKPRNAFGKKIGSPYNPPVAI